VDRTRTAVFTKPPRQPTVSRAGPSVSAHMPRSAAATTGSRRQVRDRRRDRMSQLAVFRRDARCGAGHARPAILVVVALRATAGGTAMDVRDQKGQSAFQGARFSSSRLAAFAVQTSSGSCVIDLLHWRKGRSRHAIVLVTPRIPRQQDYGPFAVRIRGRRRRSRLRCGPCGACRDRTDVVPTDPDGPRRSRNQPRTTKNQAIALSLAEDKVRR